MKKIILIIILISFLYFPKSTLANPIVWPYLLASDYFRGTAGERLFFGSPAMQKSLFFINNDFRHYHFKHYWAESGEKYDCGEYSRMINIFSIHVPFYKAQFSLRIPFVTVENSSLSNKGISDILMGFSYDLKEFMNKRIAVSLATGLKIPTGFYEYEEDKIPIGTGSYDVPIALNTDFGFKHLSGAFDIGYIFIGESQILYPTYNRDKKRNNGDELFFDFVVIKNLNKNVAIKLESNYYTVFNSTSEGYENGDAQKKFSITPGIIFSTKSEDLKFELGFTYDLTGENTYAGYSPVLRFHYSTQ